MKSAKIRSIFAHGVVCAAMVGAAMVATTFSGLVAADEKGRYYAHLHGKKPMGQYRGKNHGVRNHRHHGKRHGHGVRSFNRHWDRHWDRRFGGFGHRFHNNRRWHHHGWRPRGNGFHIGINTGNGRHGYRDGYRHGNRFGHGGHRVKRDHKAEYLIGGLIIGSAIAKALADRESHVDSDGYATYDESDSYETDYYMHKTLKGECFEVTRDDRGRETRRQVADERCDW